MATTARLAALFCAALLVGELASAAPQQPKPEVEQLGLVNAQAARALLNLANRGEEPALYATPGMTRPVVEKILAHRAAGKSFTTVEELQKITAIPTLDLGMALASFVPEGEDAAPPAPDIVTRGKGKAAGKQVHTQGADGTPAGAEGHIEPSADAPADTSSQGPIGSVRPGFFAKLPGYEDLDSIDPLQKREFLETINRESCTCGCKTETLAFCLVNDPGCPVVKARVKKIYDDIVSKPPR